MATRRIAPRNDSSWKQDVTRKAQKAQMKGHESQKGQKLQNAAGFAADEI